MDKYELVFDLIEHPEKYTAEQMDEILSHPETKEIYETLCKADSAVEAQKKVDVDAEWELFSRKYGIRTRRRLLSFGSRAASIAVIICTSIVAVAAGIAVTVAVSGPKTAPKADEIENTTGYIAALPDSVTVPADTVTTELAPIKFENEPLETIMKKVAAIHKVEVKFTSKEAAGLHLYYKLDPALPLDEVVSQLNTFQQINIRRKGNVLTIE